MKPFHNLFNRESKQKVIHENINAKGSLKCNLDENIKVVQDTIGGSSDVIIRKIQVGEGGKIKIAVCYTEGLSDINVIQDFILKILMVDIKNEDFDNAISSSNNIIEVLKDFVIPHGEIFNISDFQNIFTHLLSGDTIILIDEYEIGYVVSSKGWKDRGIQEASTQTVVRGPKDSFTETLRDNTALIRRRIKDTNLWIETKEIGTRTKTEVSIAYIKDIANEKIVQEVRDRLQKINIDGILESGYIEELIQDKTFTPFSTIYNTERPDAAAAGLLEGRIAILVDGTPFVLLAPAVFLNFFQSPEDYYQRFDISIFIRALRFICFFIAMLTPSMYIAITTFHQEMLPTQLLISIASQREGVPFPAFFEALLMEVTFEILREASIRMPRVIGPAIAIVGALVLGQSAVEANIVSNVLVIIVSITAISSFVFPSYDISSAVRILRFVFIILAATFGLYGISLGIIALVLHLCSLRSFGIPYMSPMAPFNMDGMKDMILRFPLWSMYKRQNLVNQDDVIRQQSPSLAKPKPPEK